MRRSCSKKIVVSVVFLIILLSISIPVIFLAGADQQGFLYVYLTLGNDNPVITWVNDSVSLSPVESGIRTVYIQFNASDANGLSDLNDSSAKIVLNLSGETVRSNTSCSVQDSSGNTKMYLCAVSFMHYDKDGEWTINASVDDKSGENAYNETGTFTYGTLKAVLLGSTELNFSGVSLGQQNAEATQNPLQLDNSGNQNITIINVTAFNLVKNAELINVSAVSVNVTDTSGVGTALSNSTPINIPEATLPRDIGGTDANETMYFWIDVPASGLSEGLFNASEQWVIDVD